MIKEILRNWHRYVVWTLVSVMFWSWVVVRITDALPKNKVVLYADLYEIDGKAVEAAVEPDLPEGIRFMEVNMFDSMLFQPTAVLTGDLYLVPEMDIEAYAASFLPLDRSLFEGAAFYEYEGNPIGVCVFDPDGSAAVGADMIGYFPDQKCYLCINRESKHIGKVNDSPDDAAIVLAKAFFNINKEDSK